jgi:hypothetical protein
MKLPKYVLEVVNSRENIQEFQSNLGRIGEGQIAR